MSVQQQFADWHDTRDAEIASPAAVVPLPVVVRERLGESAAPQNGAVQRALKRTLDLSLALPLLILCAPLIAVIAALIRLEGKGPVLFRQSRLGRDGKPFTIVKFRTLTVVENGNSITQVRRNDLRATRVGRWLRRTSLDELPQFLNVVSGEMSLVGPRPHAVAHDRLYGALIENYQLRQCVKPGITGWAQVNGARGETPRVEDMHKRVLLDIWYVRNAGFALDLRILARTPLVVLTQRNAH